MIHRIIPQKAKNAFPAKRRMLFVKRTPRFYDTKITHILLTLQTRILSRRIGQVFFQSFQESSIVFSPDTPDLFRAPWIPGPSAGGRIACKKFRFYLTAGVADKAPLCLPGDFESKKNAAHSEADNHRSQNLCDPQDAQYKCTSLISVPSKRL